MKFEYAALDKQGKPVRDTVEAGSAGEAREALRERGLFVSELKQAAGRTETARPTRRGAGKLKHLVNFSRQAAVLVGTGTPVVEALASLERQSADGAWRGVLADLRSRVEEGQMLSEAMAAHPEYFDGVARCLVAAGETGGRLDMMLDRLAKVTRQQQKIESSIKGAMAYPLLLTAVAVGVLGLMIGFVLPRFEGLFQTLGAPLPPTTAVLMRLSELLRAHWMMALGGAVAGAVGVWRGLGSAAGRRLVDRVMVTAPTVGPMARAFATARIARILGVLLEARVTLLDALRMVRESTGNSLYVELIRGTEEAVTRGESMSGALGAEAGTGGARLIAPSVCEAVRSGEKSGRVGAVLISVADALDEDNEVVLRSLTSIIEPLILLVLGLVVGTVAVSMFLPLFDLTAAGGAGGAS